MCCESWFAWVFSSAVVRVFRSLLKERSWARFGRNAISIDSIYLIKISFDSHRPNVVVHLRIQTVRVCVCACICPIRKCKRIVIESEVWPIMRLCGNKWNGRLSFRLISNQTPINLFDLWLLPSEMRFCAKIVNISSEKVRCVPLFCE